jgi:Ca2+-binding RTX toxin-like protein
MQVTGGPGTDIMTSGGGSDVFFEESAGNGNDTFNGGPGTDTVSYASRTNGVVVTIGADPNDGEQDEFDFVAADIENVFGGSGVDTLTGDADSNQLGGGGSGDTIFGGGSLDFIFGGGGDDTLVGDEGNDLFHEEGTSNGADTFDGGSGFDTVGYDLRTVGVNATIGSGDGNDGQAGESDTIEGDVEGVRGGSGADQLTGDGLDNQLNGGSGADELDGNGGDDELHGGPQDLAIDTLEGGAGEDELIPGGGADLVFPGPDADVLLTQDTVADQIDCAGGGADTGTVDLTPPETYIGCADADGDTVPDLADECDLQSSTNPNGCPISAPAPVPPAPVPATPRKCKKGKKLKKGKCVKKKKKRKKK